KQSLTGVPLPVCPGQGSFHVRVMKASALVDRRSRLPRPQTRVSKCLRHGHSDPVHLPLFEVLPIRSSQQCHLRGSRPKCRVVRGLTRRRVRTVNRMVLFSVWCFYASFRFRRNDPAPFPPVISGLLRQTCKVRKREKSLASSPRRL